MSIILLAVSMANSFVLNAEFCFKRKRATVFRIGGCAQEMFIIQTNLFAPQLSVLKNKNKKNTLAKLIV